MAIAAMTAKRGRMRAWLVNSGPVLGIFLAIFLLWELCCWLFKVPDFILPSPSVIIDKIVSSWWLLLVNGLVTAQEIVLGFRSPSSWSIRGSSSASPFLLWCRCRLSRRSRSRRSW